MRRPPYVAAVVVCFVCSVVVTAETGASLSSAPADTAVKATAKPTDDTVMVLKGRNDTATGLPGEAIPVESKIRAVMSTATTAVEKTRRQGYGLAGGFSPAIAGVSMKPVFDMVSRESMLKTKTFPGFTGGYQPMLLTGGLGYFGIGNGMRVGGGGWGGSLRYPSDAYATANGDSIAVLSVKFNYGGVLLEKVWLRDRLNIIFGGMWDFGAIEVVPDFFSESDPSAFASLNSGKSEISAKADFTGLELHGGGTYTVFSWLHLGLDVNALFFISAKGFAGQGGANGFLGAVPGGRIRLVFGNLG